MKQQIDAKFWAPLEKQYQVTVEPFAQPPADDAKADVETEIGSDLNAPLERVLKQHRDLRAVLLLSDGDWNLGKSPITAATALAQRDVPVFTVGVGSETYLPDVELQSVLAPTYGLVNERISVMFTVQNHLPREVKTTVTVQGPGGATGHESRDAAADGAGAGHARFHPAGGRRRRLHGARCRSSARRFSRRTTSAAFHLAVRKETLKVLVVDSQPRWEFRYLRNALMRDPGVAVNTVLYHPAIGMGEGVGLPQGIPGEARGLAELRRHLPRRRGHRRRHAHAGKCDDDQGARSSSRRAGSSSCPARSGGRNRSPIPRSRILLPVETDYVKGTGFASGAEARLELTFRGRDHWLTMLATDPAREPGGVARAAGILLVRAGGEGEAGRGSARGA